VEKKRKPWKCKLRRPYKTCGKGVLRLKKRGTEAQTPFKHWGQSSLERPTGERGNPHHPRYRGRGVEGKKNAPGTETGVTARFIYPQKRKWLFSLAKGVEENLAIRRRGSKGELPPLFSAKKPMSRYGKKKQQKKILERNKGDLNGTKLMPHRGTRENPWWTLRRLVTSSSHGERKHCS